MKKHGIRKAVAGLIALLLLAGCAASPPSESGFETTIPTSKETESITTTNAVIPPAETEQVQPTTEPVAEDAPTEVPDTDQAQPIIESTAPAPETSESAAPETSKPTEPAPPQPTEPAPTQQKPSEPAPHSPSLRNLPRQNRHLPSRSLRKRHIGTVGAIGRKRQLQPAGAQAWRLEPVQAAEKRKPDPSRRPGPIPGRKQLRPVQRTEANPARYAVPKKPFPRWGIIGSITRKKVTGNCL